MTDDFVISQSVNDRLYEAAPGEAVANCRAQIERAICVTDKFPAVGDAAASCQQGGEGSMPNSSDEGACEFDPTS